MLKISPNKSHLSSDSSSSDHRVCYDYPCYPSYPETVRLVHLWVFLYMCSYVYGWIMYDNAAGMDFSLHK